MTDANRIIKDAIIEAALPNVAFDGWTQECLAIAAEQAGYSRAMARAVFLGDVEAALTHLSGWADRRMLERLEAVDAQSLKIRERIAVAVMARLDVLAPHREAERLALAYWLRPLRKVRGAKLLWNTADAIWLWAGDTATDYNRYTKRALLSGVISSTVLFWLNDTSSDLQDTREFLERRIGNALKLGGIARRFKSS